MSGHSYPRDKDRRLLCRTQNAGRGTQHGERRGLFRFVLVRERHNGDCGFMGHTFAFGGYVCAKREGRVVLSESGLHDGQGSAKGS